MELRISDIECTVRNTRIVVFLIRQFILQITAFLSRYSSLIVDHKAHYRLSPLANHSVIATSIISDARSTTERPIVV